MSDSDVIVVGGGHNGLICAAYLARAKFDVLLLEARDTVGGAASTVDAIGARVNICNCDHIMIRDNPVIEELGLSRRGLRYLDVEPAMLNLTWERARPWFLFHSVERTLASLAQSYPTQVQPYRQYLKIAQPLARLILDLGNEVPTRRAILWRLMSERGGGLTTYFRWSRASLLELMSRIFSEEPVLLPAAATLGAGGIPPDRPGSGLGALAYAVRHLVPTGRPVGGSGALAEAVRACLESAGGKVRCNARVNHMLVDNDQVLGVELIGGEIIRAPTVVSAIDPRTAMLTWFKDPPPIIASLRHRLSQRTQMEGYESKVDAVVASLPRYRSVDEAMYRELGVSHPLIATTTISPPMSQIIAGHQLLIQGRVARRLINYVNIPSVLDPSMKPGPSRDEHVFSLECMFTPLRIEHGWQGSGEPERWLQCFSDLVQEGFLAGVRRWRAVTPDIYESDFHLPKGVPPAYSASLQDIVLGRNRELTRYETALKGLFLTGSGTFPGAGIWGASGRNAASVIISRM